MHNYNIKSISIFYTADMFRCYHHHEGGTHHIIT